MMTKTNCESVNVACAQDAYPMDLSDQSSSSLLAFENQLGSSKCDHFVDLLDVDLLANANDSFTTESTSVTVDSSVTLVSLDADNVDGAEDVKLDSSLKKNTKTRNESGATSIAGRHSDSSSLVDSVRNTEDGYEGGSSDSDDECEWLREMDFERPKVCMFVMFFFFRLKSFD